MRLLSQALTGYFYTFTRPRTATPMSMLKYDPIGTRENPIPAQLPLDIVRRSVLDMHCRDNIIGNWLRA